MKRTTILILAILLCGFALWKCSTKKTGTSLAVTLPQDVLDSCTVSQSTFNTWFASSPASVNGLVTPANSVLFPHSDNCDFYQWAERMFLWVTSPINGGTVLNSPTFYNVTPPDSAGNRQLLPQTLGAPVRMTSHLVKLGPSRLPVIVDKNGNFFEVEKSAPNAKDFVKDESGKTVEVGSIVATGKTFSFVDKAGKAIAHPHAIIQHKNKPGHFVHQFVTGDKAVFLDGDGNVVDSEEGQATGDALMAQNGSVVYYLTLVNDVYAEYLNMVKTVNPAMRDSFPTTAADRHAIVAYAKANNVNLADSNALAMEIKSSWIEASKLGADTVNYVLMTAVIPTYDTTSNKIWKPNGEKTVRMAMVGMHIVGSVATHPEMIWATFEHQNNTPNAAYSYINTKGATVGVKQDSGSNWLFSANASALNPNFSHITTNDPKIKNGPNTDTLFGHHLFNISPSNTLRTMPWGSQSDANAPSNPQDTTSARSNSEILSINNAIRSMLAGDIRANYLFIGAVWTPNGSAPTGTGYTGTHGAPAAPGETIGASVLANSTMETYFQSKKHSCFTCHSANVTPDILPDTISHVFSAIQTFAQESKGKAAPKKK